MLLKERRGTEEPILLIMQLAPRVHGSSVRKAKLCKIEPGCVFPEFDIQRDNIYEVPSRMKRFTYCLRFLPK